MRSAFFLVHVQRVDLAVEYVIFKRGCCMEAVDLNECAVVFIYGDQPVLVCSNIILPVSISVGSSGVVLISIKSQQNVPPYRIENICKNVHLKFKQVGTSQEDTLEPKHTLQKFAWDEPTQPHHLDVEATLLGPGCSGMPRTQRFRVEYIDNLGAKVWGFAVTVVPFLRSSILGTNDHENHSLYCQIICDFI